MKKIFKRFGLLVAFVTSGAVYLNCTGGGFQPVSSENSSLTVTPPTPASAQGQNVMPLFLGAGSLNQLSVSMTICVPGTNTCQTVSDLLLDTGSSGVRIFASALGGLATSLPKLGLGNCTSYADNTYDWGAVASADLQLGQEMARNVPVQIVDDTYGDRASACVASINAANASQGISGVTPTADVASQGYNGIVGVNFLAQDCGSYCVTYADSGTYFACSGSSCTASTAALAQQLTNPVSLLTYDNNGVVLNLPAISGTGTSSATGTLYLGVGTQPNNTPVSGVRTLTADPNETDANFTYFSTSFQGSTLTGFIDSGSGCLSFPFSNTSLLPTDSSGNFIPSSPVFLSATQIGYNGVNAAVNFTIAAANSSQVQPECGASLGSSFASGDFDWGLPFFLGRTVFVGLENHSSSLGSGLYWAW